MWIFFFFFKFKKQTDPEGYVDDKVLLLFGNAWCNSDDTMLSFSMLSSTVFEQQHLEYKLHI